MEFAIRALRNAISEQEDYNYRMKRFCSDNKNYQNEIKAREAIIKELESAIEKLKGE